MVKGRNLKEISFYLVHTIFTENAKKVFSILVRVGSNIAIFTPLAYHVVIFHEY